MTECQGANEGPDEPVPVNDDEVHETMTEIIRHHIEYGCNRNDKIEFSAPKEVLVRCKAGSEPQYQYSRPSKCNMCEETGMTKEYGCAYFINNGNQQIAVLPADNWEDCSYSCMLEPACESASWHEGLKTCILLEQSFDTADKDCNNPGVIGGRKCHAERECAPLVCDKCAEHGFTFNEGPSYEIKKVKLWDCDK